MESLKERILKEMVIEDKEAWQLAKQIFNECRSRLKEGILLQDIYNRIRELKS